MAFWSTNNSEPLRKFRFIVTFGEELWYAKSVSKPSFDVSTSEYQLVNHKIKYPGVVTWNDIDIVIVDTKEKKKGLAYYKDIVANGYNFSGGANDGIMKKLSVLWSSKDVLITQLGSDGKKVEEWKLINPFVKSIKFGDLDYSSDDLVEITITVTYDSAVLS